MNSNAVKLTYLYLIAQVILTYVRISDATVVTELRYGYKRYTFVLNRKSTQVTAETICSRDYGSFLAKVIDDESLTFFNNELKVLSGHLPANIRTHELWLWGKTDVKHGNYINLKSDPVPSTNGMRCVILSNYISTKYTRPQKYNLYSRNCTDNSEKNFICENLAAEPAKYIYGQTAGNCPTGTMLSSGSVYMKREGCSRFGGVFVMGDMVQCNLDWCGTNSTEEINGIVFAAPGHCSRSRHVTGMIPSMARHVCTQFGGIPGGNGSVVNCYVDWCWITEALDERVYTFSAPELCDADRRVYPLNSVLSISTGICRDLITKVYGEQFILPGESSQSTTTTKPCILDFCNIGTRQPNIDCKMSEMGKEYSGTLSRTISGKQCQRWDSNFPHDHGNYNSDWFPDATLQDASNFCRNPADWAEGPFCFTTDPAVEWEICDIPFCEGKGPKVRDIQIGITRYTIVPGQHSNPWDYCKKKFNARAAMINTYSELEQISPWLQQLISQEGSLVLNEIWIGGRAPSSAVRGEMIKDKQRIDAQGSTGHCIMLSNWDSASNGFNNKIFDTFAGECPQYYRQFLCESVEFTLQNYQVDGGIPQMEIHDLKTCNMMCEGNCRAAGFHSLEETCWHYFGIEDCKPGRIHFGFTYIQREPCNCHKYLVMMDDEVKLEASSYAPATFDTVANTAARANLNTFDEVTQNGIIPGAWIPAVMDDKQWIKAHFPELRLVYGIVTKGLNGSNNGMVKTYTINYTMSADCDGWQKYEKLFTTALNDPQIEVTHIFQQAIFARCIQIIPKEWVGQISLKFDVLGCFERYNIALGKQVTVYTRSEQPTRAVDGFSHSSLKWNSCYASYHGRQNPWFAVDLIGTYLIEEVHIYSARDSTHQLRKLSVRSHMQKNHVNPYRSEQECAFIPGAVEQASVLKVKCENKLARYIVIQKMATEMLAVCEVKVYGKLSDIQNVALHKPANQSSDLPRGDGYLYASLATDGQTKPEFSSTMKEKDPWWMVDLQNEYTIYEIIMDMEINYFVSDLVQDIYVEVGSGIQMSETGHYFKIKQLCSRINMVIPRQQTLFRPCIRPMDGRYVQITFWTPSQYLSLFEVQVFGHRAFPKVYGGNTTGSHCKIPFIYNGTSYSDCIRTDERPHLWCSTADNYDEDQQWGYCLNIKLVDGRDRNEGRVRIRTESNQWGTICDDGWDDKAATVVCKQLGYKDGKAMYHPFFGQGTGLIMMGSVSCKGNESSLLDCKYTKTPSYCTHHEDAGVLCSNSDGLFKVGYPILRRSQRDTLNTGIIIMPFSQEIKVPGKISAFQLYSTKSKSTLKLQIWRRFYDLKGFRLMLVGQEVATEALGDDGPVRIQSEKEIKVQAGDLIGFSFANGNPITFDNTFHCEKRDKVIYKTKHEATVGSIHSFPTKDNPVINCRMYSLYAEIEVQKASHLHEFVFNGGTYRVYTTKQPFRAIDHLCKSYMGENAKIYDVHNAGEYQNTKQNIADMGVVGSFWVRNKLEHSGFIQEWAPCQPEKGKDCLAFSNDNNDGTFKWFTKSCGEKLFFICENSTEVEYSTDSNTTPLHPHAKSGKGHHFSDWRILLAIVLIITVVIFVAVLLVLLIRYKRKRFRYSAARLFSTESTSPLHGADTEHEDDDGLTVKSANEPCSVKVENVKGKQTENNGYELENPMYGSNNDTSQL